MAAEWGLVKSLVALYHPSKCSFRVHKISSRKSEMLEDDSSMLQNKEGIL